jgi:fatty acid desaturase
MTRRVATPAQPRPTVHYYPLPEEHTELALRSAAEVAAKRRRDAARYQSWRRRQAEIAEQDRRTRHFLLGLGAVVGTGVLIGAAVAVWAIWRALAGVEWIVVLPLAAFALIVLGSVGHRCITIVQHWH